MCTTPRSHSSRDLLDKEFFVRSKLPVNARRWNLACLATHLVFAKQRMTLRTSPAGASIYGERRSPRRTARESHLLEQRPTLAAPAFAGNIKDGADAVAEINNVCAWLMD